MLNKNYNKSEDAMDKYNLQSFKMVFKIMINDHWVRLEVVEQLVNN